MEAAAKVVQYAPDNAMNMYVKTFTERTSIESLYFVPYFEFTVEMSRRRAREHIRHYVERMYDAKAILCTATVQTIIVYGGVAKPPCHIHSLSFVFAFASVSLPPSLLIALFLSHFLVLSMALTWLHKIALVTRRHKHNQIATLFVRLKNQSPSTKTVL